MDSCWSEMCWHCWSKITHLSVDPHINYAPPPPLFILLCAILFSTLSMCACIHSLYAPVHTQTVYKVSNSTCPTSDSLQWRSGISSQAMSTTHTSVSSSLGSLPKILKGKANSSECEEDSEINKCTQQGDKCGGMMCCDFPCHLARRWRGSCAFTGGVDTL